MVGGGGGSSCCADDAVGECWADGEVIGEMAVAVACFFLRGCLGCAGTAKGEEDAGERVGDVLD